MGNLLDDLYDLDEVTCAGCGGTRLDVMTCEATYCDVTGCECVVEQAHNCSWEDGSWFCDDHRPPSHHGCPECDPDYYRDMQEDR